MINEEGVPSDRRRSIENLSKDELIALFQKIKVQTLQISSDKKEAVQQAEYYKNERDDFKAKAQQLVLHCKNLEETIRLMSIREQSHESEIDALTRARASSDPSVVPVIREMELKLAVAHDEIQKYKSGLDKAIPKLKELKTMLETKTLESEQMKNENSNLKYQLQELSSRIRKKVEYLIISMEGRNTLSLLI